MNNRSRPPSLFPWPSYISGPHSSLTSAPRFPYDISGASPPSFSYPHGSPGHVTGGYLGRQTSPPKAFRASPPPRAPVGSRLEYSKSPDRYSRYSASSSPRRRFPDDDFIPENASVVVNAGFSFLMGKETSIIHKHVDVQPAHAIPEAPSSGLTRQIDKFLKKSDHTLDRYHNVVQSRSGGMVGGWRHRGKSMTPAGGREESPEPSTLGLSYRSQRSTSAASIAVKAEKHLESLKSGDKAKRKSTAAAPIAEHEEDQLDDDLSSTDSSLDGFDTDDDVPRSTDVFDISDDTSADLSKLSAIEVDPATNCSTPFDPSRLDDLSSDSDDEYFDVVQLPGLRAPQPSSTRTPSSTSPLPDQQQPKPSEGDATQEPSHNPPAHSQSMPAVNKGLSSGKMGNIQYSPSTVTGTDTKQPVDTTQCMSHRSSADTANLANAINVLAPLSSTKSKPENSSSGGSKFKVKNTNKSERKLKKECSPGQEANIAGNTIDTGSLQSSHLHCKDEKPDTHSTSAGMLKEESDVEAQKVANSNGNKKNDLPKSVIQYESNTRNILGTVDPLKPETKLDLGSLPKSQNTGKESLELQKTNQSNVNVMLTSTLKNERKNRELSNLETKPKGDLEVKSDLESMQKSVVTITSTSNTSTQKEYITNKDEITPKVKIVSDIILPKDPRGKNTEKNPKEEKCIDGKIGETISKGKILETVNTFKTENSLEDQVVKEITKSTETEE
ncbi:nucleolar protein dao-5-like isoform X3 [Macrobrachium nipponense]|uniref:nucleolar protein dao-5-like isoform X3 n=1 Tax=Macrobrachium nipponense TaxID=159736 RepID=UPI0030C7F2C5